MDLNNRFYIDTCIYINLLQKEGDASKGKPYWKISRDFLDNCKKYYLIIYYSDQIIKELSFIISEDNINEFNKMIKNSGNFKKTFLSLEDKNTARKIEKEIDYKIGFYDILHMILAEKNNAILITRDKDLIEISNLYGIISKKPEEYLK